MQNAKDYINKHNIRAVYIETKDRFNEYQNKRIIRVVDLGDENLEVLYTGFPAYKETE